MGKFTPAIFIGVGGVGKNILLRIRRMIVENHKKLENLPSVRFLHVDTDVNPGPDAGSSIPLEVMGQSLYFKDSEKCDLSQRITQEIAQGRDTIKNSNAVKEWFDDTLQLDLNFKEGAGGIRPYGRLAFHYSVDIFRQKVENAVSDAQNPLNLQKTSEMLGMSPGNNLDVYIVCSLLGGTGSGTFLEVCYNTLVAAKGRGVTPYIAGVFVISGNVDERRKANCYSALMELEYHSTASLEGKKDHFSVSYPLPVIKPVSESGSPVSLCYLVSHVGEGGYLLERNGSEEAIALNLYMEFGSVISNEKRSRRTDFTSIQEYQQVDDEMRRSRQFLSFGISTLEFPAPRVQEMLAHELASIALKGWLFEEKKESPDLDRDLREIKERLDEESLIKEILTIDNKNVLQRVNSRLSEQEGKARDLIEASKLDANLIITTVNNNINTNIESVNFSMDPKLCGEHAREIAAKAKDRQNEIARIITQKVNYLVENKFRGPREAKAYLSGVYRLLTDKINTFEGKYNSFQNSAMRAQDPIYAGVQKLRDSICGDKFAMNHHNKKVHTEFMASYMGLSLKREAYRAAHEILKMDRSEDGIIVQSLLSLVDTLLKKLGEYTQILKTLSEGLDGTRQKIEATIIGTPIAEGIKLTSSRLKEIAKGVIPNPISNVEPLLNYIKDALGEKDKEGNVIEGKRANLLDSVTRQKDDVVSLLIQKCSEICEGVRKISVASELKDKPNLADILSHKIRLSKPMIQAAGFKSGEDVRLNWLATAEPIGDLKIICDAINHIHQYKGSMKDRHLENLSDPYQIIFASEKGIFPLRRITILNEFRKDYRMIKPKHTDIRIPYPDIFPTTEEDKIKERSEQAVFFGKFFEYLSEKEDPESGYKHIYLSYFDDSSRTTVNDKLADEWKKSEELLVREQIKKEIDKQRAGITALDKLESLIARKASQLKTKKEKEETWISLQEHLESTAAGLSGGDMHDEYKRQRGIIQRFRDKYGIMPPEPYGQKITQPTKKPELGQELPKRENSPDFEKSYRDVLVSYFKKGITNKEKLVAYGIRFLKLDSGKASAIFDEAISAFQNVDNVDIGKKLEAYKQDFDLAILDGEITNEERKFLREKQQELSLTDEEVRSIEEEQTTSLYRNIFQEALMDNVIQTFERGHLREVKSLLNLSDEQVKNIESDFKFEEE